MKYCAFFIILLFLQFNGYAESQDWDLSICSDSLYLSLKARDINSLQEREYEYLMRAEKDCNKMKLLKYKKEEQKENTQ